MKPWLHKLNWKTNIHMEELNNAYLKKLMLLMSTSQHDQKHDFSNEGSKYSPLPIFGMKFFYGCKISLMCKKYISSLKD